MEHEAVWVQPLGQFVEFLVQRTAEKPFVPVQYVVNDT